MTWGPLAVTVGGVAVRWRDVASIDAADGALLDPVEVARRDAYVRAVDRDRFTLGAATARRLVGELLDVAPTDVVVDRTCPDCGRPHGRPRVVGGDVDHSVSHAGGWVVVAGTRRPTPGSRVGVDVEVLDVEGAAGLGDGVLTDAERRRVAEGTPFADLWVAKEAAVKATGEGLRRPLDTVEVAVDESASSEVLRWTGPGVAPTSSRLLRLDAPPGHRAALAVLA